MTKPKLDRGHRMNLQTHSTDSGIRLAAASVMLTGRRVLSGLSAHLTEQRIGIIGRNGSGKSTLLRLMAGLIAPDSGEVRVDGLDPFRDRKAMLSRLGILFQNPDHQILFPTVDEELAFGLVQLGLPKAVAEARVNAHLASHGRRAWRGASVATLSQGQRHWLCLQAVLLMEPHTILLDEPLAGLDLPTQTRLARAFAALPQRLVTITHDPSSLAGCDRVLWLEHGEIAADGPPAQVLPRFEAEMHRLGALDADADLAG
jgi:biotin transport system ATP-binding protein